MSMDIKVVHWYNCSDYLSNIFGPFLPFPIIIQWKSLAGRKFGEFTRFEHLAKKSLAKE